MPRNLKLKRKPSRSIKGRYWYRWVYDGCPVCPGTSGHRERVYYSEELPNDNETYSEPHGCSACFG